MADKFQNKYRIPSARLRTWDYGLAAYFVTVCTDNRRHFFGEITGGKMVLSEIGSIVEHGWLKSPSMRPDMNLELDAFCVMPNHFHAIIIIGNNQFNDRLDTSHRGSSNNIVDPQRRRDAMPRVSTTTDDDNDTTANDGNRTSTMPPPGNKFGVQTKNLASVMRGFKSAVTVAPRVTEENFKWQTRFRDHIIRNDLEFGRIRKYIVENPQNWHEDRFYSAALNTQ